jgi:hypothetical protein
MPPSSCPPAFASRLALAALALALAGCASKTQTPPPSDPGLGANAAGATAKGGPDVNAGVGVNAYLWRGALDILSFMPLASEDPFGGVIMTDWYQPTSVANERFRATAYILGRQMRADAIRVTLFRQVQQNGQWVDAPVSKVTVGELESKVLARARELRTHDLAHGATDSY